MSCFGQFDCFTHLGRGPVFDHGEVGDADDEEVDLLGLEVWLPMANLQGATADRHTMWPEGFDPIAAGVIFR